MLKNIIRSVQFTTSSLVAVCVLSAGLVSPASANDCIDTSPEGDGWGWNGQQSCKLEAATVSSQVCVDTGVIGDGWGWDGIQSCELPRNTMVSQGCVDTAPVGDGWGWDGLQSCIIGEETIVSQECIDTAPVGDGWGWNGSESCTIPVLPTNTRLKIMPVGDSITHGTLGQRSYRFHLQNRLQQNGCDFEMVGSQIDNQTATSFKSPHEGYSHHRAHHFLTGYASSTGMNEGIIAAMEQSTPDIVLLHIGSNDMYGGDGVPETVSEIREILARISSANAEVKVFLANVIPWYGTSRSNPNVTADVQALAAELRKLVEQSNDPNLWLVDVNTGYNSSMMLPDMVHPSNSGETHIAEAFYQSLNLQGICVAQ